MVNGSIPDETAGKMLVALLDAHKFLGAEAHEMVGVKVRRETVGRVDDAHKRADIAQKFVAEIMPVNAVYVAESVDIIAHYAILSAGIFRDPLLDAIVKPGRVVAAGHGVVLARDDIGDVFQKHRDLGLSLVGVTESYSAENVAVVFVDGIVIDGERAALVQSFHYRRQREHLFHSLAVVRGQVFVRNRAHLFVAVCTVVARDAG